MILLQKSLICLSGCTLVTVAGLDTLSPVNAVNKFKQMCEIWHSNTTTGWDLFSAKLSNLIKRPADPDLYLYDQKEAYHFKTKIHLFNML